MQRILRRPRSLAYGTRKCRTGIQVSVKRIRAHDGCLGAIRRRRTQRAAKSRGDRQRELIRGYPNGETPQSRPLRPRSEHIGTRGDTRGSETSQYPEEKTSIEIPRVVASESGAGQTGKLAFRGCGSATWHWLIGRRTVWKVRPERVKAPYPKPMASLANSQVPRDT